MTTSVPEHQVNHTAWRAWVHLGGLVVLAGIVNAVGTPSGLGFAEGLRHALDQLPEFYFGALPVLVAISVGMLAFSRTAPRQGLVMALAVMVAMLLLDWLSGGMSGRADRVGLQASGLVSATRAGDFTSVSLLKTALAILQGDLVVPATRATRYGPGDPILVAAFSVLKAGHLLLPVILVGMVLGGQAWIADHVTFRRPIDETVARVSLAWVFAPAAFYLAVSWADELLVPVLFGSASLMTPLLPFLVLLIVSAVGWYTSWRVSRWLD